MIPAAPGDSISSAAVTMKRAPAGQQQLQTHRLSTHILSIKKNGKTVKFLVKHIAQTIVYTILIGYNRLVLYKK
jgi:hypothetical protein